jgi:hypothetical protein
MKNIIKLSFLLLFSVNLYSQCIGNCTSVTATLTDTSAQVWTNATVTINLVPPFSNPAPMLNNGVPVNSPNNVITTNSSGIFTISLDDNAMLTPAGSRWNFTMCPNATTANCSTGQIFVTGSAQNLSASLSSYLAVPNVNAGPTLQRAYSDSEANGGTGSVYWNTGTGALKGCYIGPCPANSWQSLGNLGVPGSNTQIPYNNGAGAFAASSNFTFNSTTNTLNTVNGTFSGILTDLGSVSFNNGGSVILDTWQNIIGLGGPLYPCTDTGAASGLTNIALRSPQGGVLDMRGCINGGVTASHTLTISTPVAIWLPCQSYGGGYLSSASPVFDVVSESVAFFGCGVRQSFIQTSNTVATIFKIESTAQFFTVKDLYTTASVNNLIGAAFNVGASNGTYQNIRIEPMGYGILCNTNGCSTNAFENIHIGGTDGASSWMTGIYHGVASGTVTSNSFTDITISADTPYSDSAFVFEGGTDTIVMSNIQIANGANAIRCMHFSNTLANPLDPKWISITNLACQPGTTNLGGATVGVQIDDVRDLKIVNSYFQSGYRNVAITGGTGIRVSNSNLSDTVRENVYISGGDDVNFDLNRIGDANDVGTTNTYANVHLASGASNVSLSRNQFKTIVLPTPTLYPSYDVLIDSGAVDYHFDDNRLNSTGVIAHVLDNATSATRSCTGNTPIGVFNNCPGLTQTASVSGCTTAASTGGVCATPMTITWPFAFDSTSYKLTCTPVGAPTALPNTPYAVTLSVGSATLNYFAGNAVAASWPSVTCTAIHN